MLFYILKQYGDVEVSTYHSSSDFVSGGNPGLFLQRYFDVDQFESKEREHKVFHHPCGISTNGVKISLLYKIDTDFKRGATHQRKKEFQYLKGMFQLLIILFYMIRVANTSHNTHLIQLL